MRAVARHGHGRLTLRRRVDRGRALISSTTAGASPRRLAVPYPELPSYFVGGSFCLKTFSVSTVDTEKKEPGLLAQAGLQNRDRTRTSALQGELTSPIGQHDSGRRPRCSTLASFRARSS